MIERYSRPEMAGLWTDRARLESWLAVELAVCEVLSARGSIPEDEMRVIRDKAAFDPERIAEIERTIGHDVIAFLTSVAEQVGPASRHIHYGLTSSDVVDTAEALRTVKAADLLIRDLDELLAVLRRQALEHRKTVMVGRTHGIHAEPYTLGLKLASWFAEMQRNRKRLLAAREEIRVGSISGAVGTYAHLGPDIEAEVLKRLDLQPEPVPTQVVARDRHAVFLSVLGVLASSIDRIATEIRHLQRSDVREVEEPFGSSQKGSSSMPHKRNPIQCENVSGLARVVRSHVQAALENVPLWHERDISHSSVERVIFPDATILCDFMLARITGILDGLLVYPDRMRRNMEITRGLLFSQRVMLSLIEKGLSRDKAYEIVQRNSTKTWEEEKDFRDLLKTDSDVIEHLSKAELEKLFDYGYYVRFVDEVFERIGLS